MNRSIFSVVVFTLAAGLAWSQGEVNAAQQKYELHELDAGASCSIPR